MLGNTFGTFLIVIDKAKIPWRTFFVLFIIAGLFRFAGPHLYKAIGPITLYMNAVNHEVIDNYLHPRRLDLDVKDIITFEIEGWKVQNCTIYKEYAFAKIEVSEGRYTYKQVPFMFNVHSETKQKGKYKLRGFGYDNFTTWGWFVDDYTKVKDVFLEVKHICGSSARETIIGIFEVKK